MRRFEHHRRQRRCLLIASLLLGVCTVQAGAEPSQSTRLHERAAARCTGAEGGADANGHGDPGLDARGGAERHACLDAIVEHWLEIREGHDGGRAAHARQEVDPSYALGVRFQRDLARRYEAFDPLHFLIGLLDASDTTTRANAERLDTLLRQVLLTPAERSDRYIRHYASRPDVVAYKGIYYIERDAGDPDDTTVATAVSTSSEQVIGDTEGLVDDDGAAASCGAPTTDSRDYLIEYWRLALDENAGDTSVDDSTDGVCLSVDDDELIRGWRTALRRMEPGDRWEVLIPAPLAYGDAGTPSGSVASGEALRFVIHLLASEQA